MDAKRKRYLFIAAGALAAVLIALALVWRFTDLADVITVKNIVDTLEHVSGQWWAPVLLVLIYTPSSIVMFPRPLLNIAAVAVFGPVKGFALALTGILVSASLLYIAGRQISKDRLRRIAGARYDALSRMFRKQGFIAVATMGLLPVAPFAVEMIFAGALRIKVRDLLPGVAIAHLPGLIGATVLGDQIMAMLTDDREANMIVIAVVVVVLVAIGYATKRVWRRMEEAAAAAS